jgi:hypothetical protein
MPIHDWALVDAGIFHDFHTAWITHLKEILKEVLPPGYYALAEQHLGRKQGDVLALHASEPKPPSPPPEPPEGEAVAVAEAPPKVHRTLVASPVKARRTLTIRHISGHRIIAMVEILSPSNKNGAESVADFIDKVVAALRSGIHVVIVDLWRPTKHDPQGIPAVVWERLDGEAYVPPEDKPLTLASYASGALITAYIEHLAIGGPLKDMPLFLTSERYVNLPLSSAYDAAFDGMPDYWCEVLAGPKKNGV